MHQVDLVDGGGARKLARAAACGGDAAVLILRDHAADGLGKGLEGRGHGVGQLCQIDHRERGGLARRALGAGADEIVHDQPAQLHRRHGCVLGELGQPVGIVPARAGLGLLGGDQIVRPVGEHQAVFQRAHQAGVKADEVKLDAALVQRLLDARQAHGAGGGELLVIAVAADRTAAVVPEDQLIAVGRKVLRTIGDEARERVRVGHGNAAGVGIQHLQVAADHLVDLVGARADHVVVPARAAAGVDDEIHLVADVGAGHLQQVLGGHAALGLQVGAAHVDHDRDLVPASAPDRRELLPRAGGHRAAQVLDIGRLGPVGLGGGGADALQQLLGDAGERGGLLDRGGGLRRGRNADDLRALAAGHFKARAAEETAESPAAAEEQQEQHHDDDADPATAAAPAAVIPAAACLFERLISFSRRKAVPAAHRAGVQPFAAAVETAAGAFHTSFSALGAIVFHMLCLLLPQEA